MAESRGITGEEIDALRALVIPALDWAVIGGKDNERHPNYVAVTEGHDPGRGKRGDVSSCGFLPSWLYFRCGVRSPWVNRDENGGYRSGVNISNLCWGMTQSVRQPIDLRSRFETGDSLITWTQPDTLDAHVMVVRSHDPSTGVLEVSEMGQPGGHTHTKQVVDVAGNLCLQGKRGDKQIRRWLSFARVIQIAAEAGQLVAPSFTAGVAK
jgi:hypothetical protein